MQPSSIPLATPSEKLLVQPRYLPSSQPSRTPSFRPSRQPLVILSRQRSNLPSSQPSRTPMLPMVFPVNTNMTNFLRHPTLSPSIISANTASNRLSTTTYIVLTLFRYHLFCFSSTIFAGTVLVFVIIVIIVIGVAVLCGIAKCVCICNGMTCRAAIGKLCNTRDLKMVLIMRILSIFVFIKSKCWLLPLFFII